MKSIVFSFKNRRQGSGRRDIRGRGVTASDIRYFFRRYGVRTIFVVLFLIGLAAGSVYAGNADSQMLDSLDFLFSTNLDSRLAQSTVGIFCACFASDFLFLSAVFLLGLAPWGIPFMSLVMMFKGFGTGLTAGYLFITYSLKGAGFYLLVLLPGTFTFCLALVLLLSYAFKFSKQIFLNTVSRSVSQTPMRRGLIEFCSHSVSALIMTFFSALLDAVLWTLFAGMFNF